MNNQVIEPVPDEYCPHIESEDAEMVGGWVFAADIPPLAVGMCRNCLNWCHDNLSQPQKWSHYVENQYAEADEVLSARVIG